MLSCTFNSFQWKQMIDYSDVKTGVMPTAEKKASFKWLFKYPNFSITAVPL